jgi:hypothetical protein
VKNQKKFKKGDVIVLRENMSQVDPGSVVDGPLALRQHLVSGSNVKVLRHTERGVCVQAEVLKGVTQEGWVPHEAFRLAKDKPKITARECRFKLKNRRVSVGLRQLASGELAYFVATKTIASGWNGKKTSVTHKLSFTREAFQCLVRAYNSLERAKNDDLVKKGSK